MHFQRRLESSQTAEWQEACSIRSVLRPPLSFDDGVCVDVHLGALEPFRDGANRQSHCMESSSWVEDQGALDDGDQKGTAVQSEDESDAGRSSELDNGKNKDAPTSSSLFKDKPHLTASASFNSEFREAAARCGHWSSSKQGPEGRCSPSDSHSRKVVEMLSETLGEESVVLKELALLYAKSEAHRNSIAYRLVNSAVFNAACTLVIVLNTAFIVHGLDASIAHTWGQPSEMWLLPSSKASQMIEIGFLAFYTLEVVLRLFGYKWMFFCGPEYTWNMFDLALVIITAIGPLVDDGQNMQSAFAMRTARIFKLAKLVRLFRVLRIFKRLYLFVIIILDCFHSLFWSVVTIALLLLMFGIYFVYSFEGWVLSNWSPEASEEVQHVNTIIQKDFNTVGQSMLTLALAIAGGRDWGEIYVTFTRTGTGDCVVFLGMIAFFHVAVWNIVASVFVESTLMSATIDRDQEALTQRRREEQDAQEFMAMCKMADTDSSGTMSLPEFHRLMSNEHAKDFFRARHLDVKDATYFFKMVEAMTDGNEVELEDFMCVMMRIKGGATSIDLQTLAIEHKMHAQKTKKFIPAVNAALSDITEKLDRIDALLPSVARSAAVVQPSASRSTRQALGCSKAAAAATQNENVVCGPGRKVEQPMEHRPCIPKQLQQKAFL
eukprot:TRINITY_DN45739_c0_g1_i4.p1 TRINITY_DN45739_c0_g1~~TRINITY_DN45739_c0_g1_i4.p1  ORF type:complete len:746 (-),score=81.92 TRINITY_DN45739_c0_g1_i4:343-2328(-)